MTSFFSQLALKSRAHSSRKDVITFERIPVTGPSNRRHSALTKSLAPRRRVSISDPKYSFSSNSLKERRKKKTFTAKTKNFNCKNVFQCKINSKARSTVGKWKKFGSGKVNKYAIPRTLLFNVARKTTNVKDFLQCACKLTVISGKDNC